MKEAYEKPAPEVSARMRAVKQRNTAAELRLRRALWQAGLRYRVHRRITRITPDIVFVGRRLAVFVDGCFWHGCPTHYRAPVNNAQFWRTRVRTNQERDRRNDRDLGAQGWRVLRFWECEVNRSLDEVVKRVAAAAGSPHHSSRD